MAWAPDYITATELKAYRRIPDAADDAEIADAISAAGRAIDLHCHRQFGVVSVAEERFYTGVWDRHRCRWLVEIDDLMSTVGLVVTSGGLAITDYTLEPLNAAAKGRPWEMLVVDRTSSVVPTLAEGGVSIVAPWGWTAVPTPVKYANKLQASRFLERRDSVYGVTGSPESGTELRLLAKVDPDVAVSLRSFVREWAAA